MPELDPWQELYVEMLMDRAREHPDPALLDRLERLLRFPAAGAAPAAASIGEVGEGRVLTIAGVIDVVARHFGRDPSDLIGDSREQSVVMARHLAMRLARDLTGASYPQLGQSFHRNHSTVMYACQQAAGLAVGDIMEAIEAEYRVVPPSAGGA